MGPLGRIDSAGRNAVRAISVFANLAYLPTAAALLNSILHFRVQAKIKVYDFAGLPHIARTHLARYAQIVSPSTHVFDEHYRANWNYRPRILSESLDPCELQLDADTVVLSDLEPAFEEIEKGNLVVLREWQYDHCNPDVKGRDYRRRELAADSVFHRILQHPELHRDGLPIYSGGLLGMRRDLHHAVVDLWAQTTLDFDGIKGTFFWVDQNKLSLVVASLLKEERIKLFELPKHLWMQTWDEHRHPRKIVSFEDSHIALYNGRLDHRMHFYHFTGDVTAPAEIAVEPNKFPVRFNAFVSDLDLPRGLTQRQMIDSWNHVWRVRHGSPVGELPMYFYSLGPVRAPKCLDPVWREFVGLHTNGASKDARETWAVALAYDYIDYAGFRAADLGWMKAPLELLLPGDRFNKGEKTVSWNSPADVSISFEPEFKDQRPWAEAATPEHHGFRSQYSEAHRGVFLNIGSSAS